MLNLRYSRKIYLTGLFLLAIFVANAEDYIKPEYAYRCYTTADGLPAMRNECLLQDGNEFIWVAGAYGFSSFNGFEFKSYLKGEYSNLMRLDKDTAGNIRAFTNNLMYTIDKKTDLTVRKEVSQPGLNLAPTCSKNLPDGYGIYFNDSGQALYAINDTALVKILEHDYLNNYPDMLTPYYDEQQKHLYLPFDDSIIVVANNNVDVAVYPGINASSFYKHHDAIFAVASDGIYRLENSKAECIFRHDIDIYSWFTKIYVDETDCIFFCSDQHFMRVKDNQIDTLFTSNIIKDFIVDNDGNFWVLTAQGLYNLFRFDFRNYVLAGKNDVVRSVIYQSEKNIIIAATLEGKVYEMASTGIRQITYPKNRYNATFFYDYGCYAGNAFYLPGPHDVLILKGNEKRWLNLPFHEFNGFVTNLHDGNFLTGGGSQLYLFNSEGKVLKEFGKPTVKQTIYAKPCTDKQRRLWLGGYDGITIYDLANDSAIITMFSDSLKAVRYMNNDCDNNVWFASENRLYTSLNDTVQLKYTFDFLIQGIFFTRNNTLIVSTLGGIYIFDHDMKNHTFYNHNNGFTGLEPTSGSMVEDAEGNVWIPSLKGLFCFNPEQLMHSSSAPKMQLLSMMASNNNVNWEKVETLLLNPLQDNVRFEYIGLSYSLTQNVRYRYRLLGFQNEFSGPIKLHEITFNNLPPKDYIFEIYADAGTEQSRSETLSVSFSVQPAFWQTTLFWVVCAAMLMLSGAGIMLYFLRKKNKKLIEYLDTERKLNDLKISSIRLKAIPHFNANVMAAIEYYIMNKSKEDTMRILGVYSRFTFETLQDVDRASRSLSEELAYVKMYLELEKLRFVDRFDYSMEVADNVDTDKIQLPNMILHTWAENAIKHGLSSKTSGGKLIIKAVQSGDITNVSIEDNGIGREAAAKNPRSHSSKQGLYILSQQIEIYNKFNRVKIHQDIEDLFAEGQSSGTRFSLTIPVSFNYEFS